MSQPLKDSFLDLERHRQLLEENIEQLQKALQHWRSWEIEYEGLKEEILAITPPPTRKQLIAIGQNYEGELLKKTELEDILGVKIPRNSDQVTNILQRRIDYVGENVKTLEKRLEVAEDKLTAASIISAPDVMNEDGLPLTEIFEELDEDGNVISSHTSTPGSSKGQLLEVLQKAGIKELPGLAPDEPTQLPGSMKESTKNLPPEDETVHENISQPRKKGVKFTEDTKHGPETEKSTTAKRIEEIMKLSKQQADSPPVIPVGESPQDAELRKEMLQYGMSEIGAVVAELDLEEDSDFNDDDDYDDYDGSSTDEEDEFGRSKRQVVDEEMRQRMIELEDRLGVRMMENAGPKAEVGVAQEGIGQISIKQDNEKAANVADELQIRDPSAQSNGSSNPVKKGVRFAEELDIQGSPDPTPAVKAVDSKPHIPTKPPVGDIVERVAPVQTGNNEAVPPQKVSKFKASRAAKGPSPAMFIPPLPPTFTEPSRTRLVPTGPAGKTLADAVVEREIPITAPLEPDELDPSLLQQEVATEYHRMRNRMIQRQGGFMKNEEDETGIVPFDEDEGGPKKISRFMAARLARG